MTGFVIISQIDPSYSIVHDHDDIYFYVVYVIHIYIYVCHYNKLEKEYTYKCYQGGYIDKNWAYIL